MFCPRCWLLIEVADECCCTACGWFGDKKETLQEPGEGFNLWQTTAKLLDLYKDICRSEQLLEQYYDAGLVVPGDVKRATLLRQESSQSLLELFVALKIRPNIPQVVLCRHENGMVPWPDDWTDNNEPCDMLVGPCACGAWHREDEVWVQMKLIQHQAVIV